MDLDLAKYVDPGICIEQISNKVKSSIEKFSQNDIFHKFALEVYAKSIIDNWNSINKETIIQNPFQFHKEDSNFKDILLGSNIDPSVGLNQLKQTIFKEYGIYESKNALGKIEYAVAGEAYDKNGKLIKQGFVDYFKKNNIYFNGDEDFFEVQKQNLIKKDITESSLDIQRNNEKDYKAKINPSLKRNLQYAIKEKSYER
ncbi:hypothetical protein [Bacillus subtilis]|uniref:hypothetical protein n=1 Tax=Bacillus subtilis TaxID=1423 RepID=UPI00084A008A|nr:hypothetical protein [Bacillus subtilis]ODV48172.1 hypothetical protein BCM26_04285 [Bacillus subtilis]OJH64129.1 hypothetical protein BOH71_07280 [Bacillus subtilis]